MPEILKGALYRWYCPKQGDGGVHTPSVAYDEYSSGLHFCVCGSPLWRRRSAIPVLVTREQLEAILDVTGSPNSWPVQPAAKRIVTAS